MKMSKDQMIREAIEFIQISDYYPTVRKQFPKLTEMELKIAYDVVRERNKK